MVGLGARSVSEADGIAWEVRFLTSLLVTWPGGGIKQTRKAQNLVPTIGRGSANLPLVTENAVGPALSQAS